MKKPVLNMFERWILRNNHEDSFTLDLRNHIIYLKQIRYIKRKIISIWNIIIDILISRKVMAKKHEVLTGNFGGSVSRLALDLIRRISETNMCSVTADEEIHDFLSKHTVYIPDENIYTEEDILLLLKSFRGHFHIHRGCQILDSDVIEWFNKVKKE